MKETKVDLHVHSIVSKCSLNPIFLLKKICKKKNILPAVCDHNKLTKLDFAIPGEEIATKTGEFIGLFLNEEVPSNLDIYEALDRVNEQGGLVYLPHPFDLHRRRSLAKFGILEDKEFLKQVDIVEVFNSRCRDITANLKAFEYAEKYGFAMGFGSDAHFIWEIENAYVVFNELDFEKPADLSPKEFLKFLKIKNDELIRSKSSLLKNPWKTQYHYGSLGSKYNITLYSKVLKKIRRKFDI